jgi:hypothetical protein
LVFKIAHTASNTTYESPSWGFFIFIDVIRQQGVKYLQKEIETSSVFVAIIFHAAIAKPPGLSQHTSLKDAQSILPRAQLCTE